MSSPVITKKSNASFLMKPMVVEHASIWYLFHGVKTLVSIPFCVLISN